VGGARGWHGVSAGNIDLKVQQTLSTQLRKENWHACRDARQRIVALGTPAARWLGIAVDIGTTKIAVYPGSGKRKTLATKGL
jgi:uncharacterized 2Fe-2S/4Fe-4S cluster protein (DUF4445 family)